MWKHASINRAYRLVWNRVQQAFVPAPEMARGHHAGGATRARTRHGGGIVPSDRRPLWRASNVALALAGLLVSPLALALDAGALPQGSSVAAGAANIAGSGNALTVTQSSDRAIVNWQSFDVGQNAGVRFVQPSTTAATLNRVTGGPASQILGTLSANGQVYLVNPAGVLFGATAQVNVGSLVASTLRIADNDFLAGRDRFTLDGATGEVSNQGRITAAQGGRVALLGARVTNTGTLHAPLGNVALAAGRQITLSAGANGHLQIAVDPADLATQVHNGGLIQAEGGQVILTAQGADALASSVVSHTGTVQAQTVATREGRILLLADPDRGTTKVAGTLDASAPHGGNGGFIETSAARVKVADSATVTTRAGKGKTGTWLIDPNDFTIAATGGDMTGAAVSTALQNTDFEIQSVRGSTSGKGDIFVNDTVNWSANTLTLTAERDIRINATMNGSASAGLALKYGQGAPAAGNTATYQVRAPVNLASTGRFSTRLGSDGATVNYTILTDLGAPGSITGTDLQGINGKLGGRYVLGSDIDASATRGWNGGAGFDPLGDSGSYFTGTFDGLGHVITELTINRPSQNYVGLFGAAQNATIRHVGRDGGSVSGNAYVGGLVGYNLASGSMASLDNVWSSGNVTGKDSYVGGLVGRNWAKGGTASISNAYATSDVTGVDNVGGLVGHNATSDNGTASISNAYATGTVKGNEKVGGLVGYNYGYDDKGTARISKAYATGAVTGSKYVAGLVGFNLGYINDSHWDRYSTKQKNGVGAGGSWNLNPVTSDPKESGAANYAFKVGAYTNLDIDSQGGTDRAWRIYDGHGAPLLRSFLKPVTVTASGMDGKTYDGTAASGTFTYATSIADALLDGTATYGTRSANAGRYVAGLGLDTGLYSGQSGYDIIYADNTVITIDKASLTVTAVDKDKIYDGLIYAGGYDVTYKGFVNNETKNKLTGTLTYGGDAQGALDAGSYAITASGLNATNYNIAYVNGTLTIGKAPIIVTANDGRSTYGDTNQIDPGFIATGLVNGQDVSVLGGLANSFGINSDTNAAHHTLIVTGELTNNNYDVVERRNGTWIVDPKPITVAANGGRSTYGDTNQIDPGLTANGLVNGQDVGVLSGLTNSFGINHGTNAGSHTLRVNGTLTNGNYLVTEARDGTWIVDPAHLLITANNAIRIANGIPYQGGNGVGYTGFVNGEDASVLEGALAYGGSAQGATQPGIYGLTAAGLRSGNYRIDYRDGSLTIGVAQGMITAGQLENSAIDARYAARHDTPFGPRPSRLVSLSQPDQGPSRLPLSFAENFIRVEP